MQPRLRAPAARGPVPPCAPRRSGGLARAAALALPLALAPGRAHAEPPPTPATEPPAVVRLADALAASLRASPELSGYAHELRALEARELQAGRRRNPTLSLELEDFAGRDELRGFSGSQTTLSLAQVFELGGKRAARVRAARLEREVAGVSYEAARLDVLADAAQSFVDVLVAQARLELARQGVALAGELGDAAERRLRAGAAPASDVSRGSVARIAAASDEEAARRALEAARHVLASRWGASEPRFERVEGELERVGDEPSYDALRAALDANPDLRVWEGERARRRALVALARSESVPDVELGPGVRYLAGPDSAALVVGPSLPLPLFGRNRGGIAEAEGRLAQASDEERAARARAGRALAAAYQEHVGARAKALSYRGSLLPAAEAAVDDTRAAYLDGRSSQLEAFDAQRALIGYRGEYLDALAAYHRSATEIERLTAAPLSGAPSAPHPSAPAGSSPTSGGNHP
jgi:cobalt-zinc-cadmium efflux system outer membrane protein